MPKRMPSVALILVASLSLGAATVRDLVVERAGEFPEVDLATTDDGTVCGVTAELDGCLTELTLNDLGSDSYLFYMLLAE